MLKTVSRLVLVAGILILAIKTFPSPEQLFKTSLTSSALKAVKVQKKYKGIVRVATTENNFFCSAAIISDTEALGAAHCFMQLPANEFVIQSMVAPDKSIMVVGAYVKSLNPRADTALIRGDFKDFDKFEIETDPEKDILVSQYELVTCGFPYGGKLVCYAFTDPYKLVDVIGGKGQMYAGMSGGPVIDLKSGKILGVNHAVTERFVIIAPIVNLFEGLMKVE